MKFTSKIQIDESTYAKLLELFPKEDPPLKITLFNIVKQLSTGYRQWTTPVLISKGGIALATSTRKGYEFEYIPWIKLKIVRKKMLGSILISKKKSAVGRMTFRLVKDMSPEPLTQNEFSELLPMMWKDAKKNKLIYQPKSELLKTMGGHDVEISFNQGSVKMENINFNTEELGAAPNQEEFEFDDDDDNEEESDQTSLNEDFEEEFEF
ncbi:MAG: hypothetical protein ACTSPD_08590 [Promethearchaeota archaeon]